MNESNGKKLKKKSSLGVFFDRLLTSKNRKPVVAAAENVPEPPKTEGRPTESSQKPIAEANDWYDGLSRRQRDYAAAEQRIAELRDRLRAMERATSGGGGCGGGGSDDRGCRDESCRAERESLRAQNYRQGVELDALRDRIAVLRDERDRLRCDRVAVQRTERDGSRGDGAPVLRDEYGGGGGGGPVDRSPMLRAAAADMQQMIDDNETAIERLIERLENETMSAGRRRDDDRDDSDNDGTVVTTPRTDSSRLQ